MRFERVTSIQGTFRPPSDKSLSHRAYLLGSIASGPSVVRKPLDGEDCNATLNCLAAMGVIYEREEGLVQIVPPATWRSPLEHLDCGNSGTTMRLLSGLIAGRPVTAVLVGDASLSRRPMRRIVEPLRMMGANIEGERAPLVIHGTRLSGIRYQSPIASAQVKSCILLAGLAAEGKTFVSEPSPSRDHTERMLAACGVAIFREGASVGVKGGSVPRGFHFTVPADISSAAFMMVAAALLRESNLMIVDLGVNPTRSGIFQVFDEVGIEYALESERSELGEPVADAIVRFTPNRRPFSIGGPLVPRLIDEIPVLAVLASQCEGTSIIRDAQELRVKESDRIEAVASGLRAMGGTVETFADGLAITGPTKLQGAKIDASGDHRIAMAFAVAGLVADGETTISGAESIATSFPMFEQELRRLSVV